MSYTCYYFSIALIAEKILTPADQFKIEDAAYQLGLWDANIICKRQLVKTDQINKNWLRPGTWSTCQQIHLKFFWWRSQHETIKNSGIPDSSSLKPSMKLQRYYGKRSLYGGFWYFYLLLLLRNFACQNGSSISDRIHQNLSAPCT